MNLRRPTLRMRLRGGSAQRPVRAWISSEAGAPAADPLANDDFREWLDGVLAELRTPNVPVVTAGLDDHADQVVIDRGRRWAAFIQEQRQAGCSRVR